MFLAIEAFPFRSVCLFPITNGWGDVEVGGCVLPFDFWCSSQARPCKELNFMRKRSTPSHDLSFHSLRMLTCFVGERCYSYLPSMLLCMIVARDSFFSLWILSKLLIWELSTICVVLWKNTQPFENEPCALGQRKCLWNIKCHHATHLFSIWTWSEREICQVGTIEESKTKQRKVLISCPRLCQGSGIHLKVKCILLAVENGFSIFRLIATSNCHCVSMALVHLFCTKKT